MQILHSQDLNEILSSNEIQLFKKLQKIISNINKDINLTRLVEGDDYWITQVYDSVWPFSLSQEKILDNKKFIDIGSDYLINSDNIEKHI